MSAFGLLLVLLIMGGMAVVVFAAVSGLGTTKLPTLTGVVTTLPPEPGGALPAGGNDLSAAEQIACRTNYEAVQQAVSYYQTLNGHPPASMADLASILKDNVNSPSYTITIDPLRPEQVDVATKGHSAKAGVANCAFA